MNVQVNKTAMSKQIVDDEYVAALSNTELNAMYSAELLKPPTKQITFPEDGLLKKILDSKYPQVVHNCEDHESLLESNFEDSLSDRDKESAWSNFQKLLQSETKTYKPKIFSLTRQFYQPAKLPKTDTICISDDEDEDKDESVVEIESESEFEEETKIEVENEIESSQTTIQTETYVYGFDSLFPDILGEQAMLNNPNADEDEIYGKDVPELLLKLFDEMDRGETGVSTCKFNS